MDGELPLNECQALGHALAAARPDGRGATTNDICDAAFAIADLKIAKWKIHRGLSGEPKGGRPAILAAILAKGRGRDEPTPRELSEADQSVDELRNLGFDLFRAEGHA